MPVELTVLELLGVTVLAVLGVGRLGLPPLVGYLLAGFVLYLLGFEKDETTKGLIMGVSDIGVTLMLFTIGLKLNLRTLFKPEIWGAASAHLVLSVGLFVLGLGVFKLFAFGLIDALDWQGLLVMAFALSFSSTVFAVKVLEEASAMQSLYGRIAIGILIMQDLFAVLFMTLASGKNPTVWALLLLAIPWIRPLLFRLLDRAGHGEMLVLISLLLAFGLGASGFSLVGLKPDLGALVAGMLVAAHPKAKEAYNALARTKDLFLVAFFLSVGLNGLPDWEIVGIAVLLVLFMLPLKTGLYFLLINKFGIRPRTGLMGALALANYSEFGLIVAVFAAREGWIGQDWLLVLALCLALSFTISARLNGLAPRIYRKFQKKLDGFEPRRPHHDEQPIELGNARVLIIGMGRVGTGAYERLKREYAEPAIIGIDQDGEKVASHQAAGRNVLLSDVTDQHFWEKLRHSDRMELVLLAMPHHQGNMFAAAQLRERGCPGKVVALCKFREDVDPLKACGVDAIFNLYREAGSAFAEDALAVEKLAN